MPDKASKLYESKKLHVAIFGLTLALIGAICNTTFQNFSVAATSVVQSGFVYSMLIAYVLSVMIIGICEFFGGIYMMIFNTVKGFPIAEYGRVLSVKSSRTILVSAIMGGPIGTACCVIAIAFCGSTYANCIIGLTPVVTAIMGMLILKEKAGLRVWCGIAICTAGMLFAVFSPPEGMSNFYLGIGIACICPIAFSLENLISTHAVDVTDPMLACPLYRMVGSAIMEFIIVFCICLFTGHLSWIAIAVSVITSHPYCILMMFCTSLFMAIQYNSTYTSYIYCGAIKAAAMLWTGTFWTIPVGFIMSAIHIIDYSVTPLGIVGAIIVVVGIMLIVAKPKELFNLRNN
jgi:drug/metabolite transporter (DMT)-like permease